MIANLDECKSKWDKPGTTSNFSGLKFLVEDQDKIIPIVGTITNKTPSGRKDGKYILPVMESI